MQLQLSYRTPEPPKYDDHNVAAISTTPAQSHLFFLYYASYIRSSAVCQRAQATLSTSSVYQAAHDYCLLCSLSLRHRLVHCRRRRWCFSPALPRRKRPHQIKLKWMTCTHLPANRYLSTGWFWLLSARSIGEPRSHTDFCIFLLPVHLIRCIVIVSFFDPPPLRTLQRWDGSIMSIVRARIAFTAVNNALWMWWMVAAAAWVASALYDLGNQQNNDSVYIFRATMKIEKVSEIRDFGRGRRIGHWATCRQS